MAIYCNKIGIKTISKETKNKVDSIQIIDNTTTESTNTYYEDVTSIEQDISRSTKTEYMDTINTTNDLTNEVIIEQKETITNKNYLGISFLFISLVFFIATIIFIKKNQLKHIKKSSK